MRPHLLYLWYVLRHKWYVFIECCHFGLPWAGLTHDLSKLTPAEWLPYVNFFYNHSSVKSIRDEQQAAFDAAWNHHQKVNPHHWQYWVMLFDTGSQRVLPIPDRYRKEMIADWRGASRAIKGTDNTVEWYLLNYDNMQLHAETRQWVNDTLGLPGRLP